jgi:hypothetical protein
VLREAFRGLTEQQLSHGEELKMMSREKALSQFIRRQLQPLLGRDEYSRHMRIFNWETVQPTTVFRSLIAEEATPFLGLAADLVRRFLPDSDQRTITIAAVWLLGQCSVFLRNREQLAEPPVRLALEESAADWLSTTISHWLLAGLDRAADPATKAADTASRGPSSVLASQSP